MNKKFKCLDNQIQHLKNDKSIIINDEDFVKKFLIKNNYYTFVDCCKVKFINSKNKYGKYIYKSSSFYDWKKYFDLDCRLIEHLAKNFIS